MIFDALLASQFSNLLVQHSAKFSILSCLAAVPRSDEVVWFGGAKHWRRPWMDSCEFSLRGIFGSDAHGADSFLAVHSFAGGCHNFPIFSVSITQFSEEVITMVNSDFQRSPMLEWWSSQFSRRLDAVAPWWIVKVDA